MRKQSLRGWFIEQHGKRPSRKVIGQLRQELAVAEDAAEKAAYLLNITTMWDSRWTTAQWTANREGKP